LTTAAVHTGKQLSVSKISDGDTVSWHTIVKWYDTKRQYKLNPCKLFGNVQRLYSNFMNPGMGHQ